MIYTTKMIKYLLLLVLLGLSAIQPIQANPPKFSKDLKTLTTWFAGQYNNQNQARRDSTVQAAHAYVVPIFENLVTDALWFYEEITDDKQQVISQRIYRFADVNAVQWEAVIYELAELPDMQKFAGEWQKPMPFDGLDPEVDLTGMSACTIIFSKKGNTKYSGASIRKECRYGKLNAYYVTTAIDIYAEKLVRADRGFEHDHTQMWGPTAEEKGFEFKKIDIKEVEAKAKAKADMEAAKAKAKEKALAKKEAARAKAEAKKAAQKK